jgi:hypothetical protein
VNGCEEFPARYTRKMDALLDRIAALRRDTKMDIGAGGRDRFRAVCAFRRDRQGRLWHSSSESGNLELIDDVAGWAANHTHYPRRYTAVRVHGNRPEPLGCKRRRLH